MADGIHRALLIGNSTFPEDPHNLPDLNGPVNDLPMLHEALSDEHCGLFAPQHIRLLPERSKPEITRAMEEFFLTADRDDLLLLYYSGHGHQDELDNLFICARDTRTDLLRSTGISDVEINGMIQASNAQTFVVILDCCHSGAFKSGGLPSNLKGTGRFLLASSRRGQPSRDNPEFSGPSAFTRYMAEALRLGTLDSNRDGYVSLNEVYDYTLTKLREDTKQIPQRHFDKTVGDVALARSTVAVEETPLPETPEPAIRPILGVSETNIEILNVAPGEKLRSEVIDVFNEGGGTLSWTVESLDDWITVAPAEGYFTVNFNPVPGTNRGAIRVRQLGGGAKTVRVHVQVNEKAESPKLRVSATAVDFGTVSVGAESPRRTIQLLNTGRGELNAHASTSEDWIDLRDYGGTIDLALDTSSPGDRSGTVVVDSDGGRAEIKVAARVEPGPVLSVEPGALRFGRLPSGRTSEAAISVSNAGRGELRWDYGYTGDFFTVERAGDSLKVQAAGAAGRHVGSIWIRSNGGEQTLDVTADIAAPAEKPAAVNGKALAGTILGLFLLSIPALILGYVARREIRKTGGVQKGRGLATTAIWLGWAGLVITIAAAFMYLNPQDGGGGGGTQQVGYSEATRSGFVAECTGLGFLTDQCTCLLDQGELRMSEQEFLATRGSAGSGLDSRWNEMESICGL